MSYPAIPSTNPQNISLQNPLSIQPFPRDPGQFDDTYAPGTEVQNIVTGTFWKCRSAAINNAIWEELLPDTSGNVGSLTGNDSVIVEPDNGNINILGSGSLTVAGSTNTETISLGGLTIYNVLVGQGTSTIGKIAPSSTAGIPFISAGSASNPVFGTAQVAGGGTGNASLTPYEVLLGGISPTGALQQVPIGDSGQVLTSNGPSLAPTFQNVGLSSFQINVQVFTASGTYTPTTGMLYCMIECVGGGGGGGSTTTTTVGTITAAGGGGSGSYSRKFASAATIGVSQSVIIGAGGAGGIAPGGNGSNGGSTHLGSICLATGAIGGMGGSTTTSACLFAAGGPGGGTGGVGDFIGFGAPGGNGLAVTPNLCLGGLGGSSIFGGGAASPTTSGASTQTDGGNYGSGGSGCATGGNGNTQGNGGNGSDGIVVITEYFD